MKYYSVIQRNKFESVELRWMKFEPFIQNEESQKEKNVFCILTHIYGIYKYGIHEPICRAAIQTQT